MPKNVGILFVASEADPFIKSGCIGDIAGSLPKTLKAQGYDIRVMLPGYGSINTRRFHIHNLLRMQDIEVPIANVPTRLNVLSSYLNNESQKVLVYFLENNQYFSRPGLYFDPATKKYFPDNDERFIFFCRGVLETLKRLAWQPQIIHCNDWQCGLIPAYLKTIYKSDPFFKNVKTVFTVYSMASHASFPKGSYEKSGLPCGLMKENGSENGKLNFLQAGLTFADSITTFGNRAEKGILQAPHDHMGKILQARKTTVVPMNGMNGHSHQIIAEKLTDIYRDLLKSN
jgi:starch synthase